MFLAAPFVALTVGATAVAAVTARKARRRRTAIRRRNHSAAPPGPARAAGGRHGTAQEASPAAAHFRTRQEVARKLREWNLSLGGRTPAERLAELRITAPSAVGKNGLTITIDG